MVYAALKFGEALRAVRTGQRRPREGIRRDTAPPILHFNVLVQRRLVHYLTAGQQHGLRHQLEGQGVLEIRRNLKFWRDFGVVSDAGTSCLHVYG